MATQCTLSRLSPGIHSVSSICSTDRVPADVLANVPLVSPALNRAARRSSSLSFSRGISSVDNFKPVAPSGYCGKVAGAGGVARAILGLNIPFFGKQKDKEKVKVDLITAIAPLGRGAYATPDDIAAVDQLAQELEKLNPTKNPLTSSLLDGKWKLIYTTSDSILKRSRPELLRPTGPIYQSINTDTLRAQNVETWPFFNQVTANLEPVDGKKVAVNFDVFKIGGLISIKAPGRARGELEITYLDESMRISRGDRGNIFILVMEDPDYRVPV